MIFKKVIAVLMSVIFVAGAFSSFNPEDVNATNNNLTTLYADFEDVTYKSKDGGSITLFVDGTNIGVNSDCVGSMNFRICDENYHPVFEQAVSGNFSVDVSDVIDVGTFYYVDMAYDADGIDYREWDAYITKTLDGDITFLKSLAYDFNVERCSELWTDAQSLQECLQPQNDVESDDPKVIRRACQIVNGCTNDWEKAFAIYSYIVNEYAYDYVQLEDDSMTYQDDALTLTRREIAICEGMANSFVALCRAAGVPAAVSFGIGYSDPIETMFDNSVTHDENPNHAWACVCLDGNWYHVDPTWDCANAYEGSSFSNGSRDEDDATYNWYLLPLEIFSMTHKICDADTIHGIEETGSCGANSNYSISRDGVCTISGSGEVIMPYGVNGFRFLEFAPGSNITSIGRNAFIDCDALEYVVLPDTVTTIGEAAFGTCEDIEYVIIPDGCTSIGENAFAYCDELAYVYIPDSVTSIGPYAFDNDGRLIISIPSNLSSSFINYDVSPWVIIQR